MKRIRISNTGQRCMTEPLLHDPLNINKSKSILCLPHFFLIFPLLPISFFLSCSSQSMYCMSKNCSDPFYIVSYDIKRVTTSWTYSRCNTYRSKAPSEHMQLLKSTQTLAVSVSRNLYIHFLRGRSQR